MDLSNLKAQPGSSVVVRICMIHVSNEAFFLLPAIDIMTKNASISCFHVNHC